MPCSGTKGNVEARWLVAVHAVRPVAAMEILYQEHEGPFPPLSLQSMPRSEVSSSCPAGRRKMRMFFELHRAGQSLMQECLGFSTFYLPGQGTMRKVSLTLLAQCTAVHEWSLIGCVFSLRISLLVKRGYALHVLPEHRLGSATFVEAIPSHFKRRETEM